MRVKLFIYMLFMVSASATFAENKAPVDCTHLLAWTAAAVPESRIVSEIQTRGISFRLSPNVASILRAAGADAKLLQAAESAKSSADEVCPASLARAGQLVREKTYDDAAQIVNQLLSNDSDNGALHFLLGFLNQQRGDWDGAFDEYTDSKQAEPDFAEVHNRLALVFFQADDGDNAIGEANRLFGRK